MAITQVGSIVTASNAAGSSTASLSPNLPGGVADGDFLIACLYHQGDLGVTMPSGWAALRGLDNDEGWGGGSDTTVRMFHRVAASEPASYTWTVSTSHYWGVAHLAFRGVHSTFPIADYVFTSTATTDPFTCGTVVVPCPVVRVTFAAAQDTGTTEITFSSTDPDTELADWGADNGTNTRNGCVYLSGVIGPGTLTGISINPTLSIVTCSNAVLALVPADLPVGQMRVV
jgi:hypothetical protein